MKQILDDLLIGFDCSNPSELTSHEIESAEVCQIEASKVDTQQAEVQILQRSNKTKVNAISCQLTRTRITSYCGNAHHTTNIDSESFFNVPQKLTRRQCIMYHSDKAIYIKEKRYKLNVGEENIIEYYSKGNAYPFLDIIGSQIVCQREEKNIDGKRISNIVEHIQDNIILETNTLIMDNVNIVDKKKDRKLKCKPEDNECHFGDMIYAWKAPKRKYCDPFETKQVQ